jgi:copper(I)-binding protein
MKCLLALAFAALALTACNSETAEKTTTSNGGKTTVSSTVDVNGKVSRSALAFSAYAVRTPPNGQTTTAAYVTVANNGQSADRLVSVSCACAAGAMFHTTSRVNGMASMNEVPDGFALPAGKTLVFAPGGNHIMLTGLTGALKEGDFADIVLTFAKAGPVTLHMPVRDAPLGDDSARAMSGMKM